LLGFDTGVTPAKTWPLWQFVQLLTIPEWFIDVPENEVNWLAEWQVSHAEVVGRWFVGLDTGVTPAKTWPLWQLAQPLRIAVWIIDVPENDVNLLAEWQVSHAEVVGRWLDGLDTGVTP
jgi:hypothetical protein